MDCYPKRGNASVIPTETINTGGGHCELNVHTGKKDCLANIRKNLWKAKSKDESPKKRRHLKPYAGLDAFDDCEDVMVKSAYEECLRLSRNQ
jgi:hypothetical protein